MIKMFYDSKISSFSLVSGLIAYKVHYRVTDFLLGEAFILSLSSYETNILTKDDFPCPIFPMTMITFFGLTFLSYMFWSCF